MADAGVGEAAAAEGAKGAGEAAAGATAADVGTGAAAGDFAGLGATGADIGAAGEAGAGVGAGAAAGDFAGLGTTGADIGAAGAGAGAADAAGIEAARAGVGAASALGGGADALTAAGDIGGAAFPAGADAAGGLGAGGTDFVPATDYSIYTGGTPTDVPDPVPDATGNAAAGAPGGATPPATDPSITDRVLGSIKNNPLTAAGLGLNVGSQILQGVRGNSLSKQLAATGQPAQNAAASLLAQYQSGEIPSSTAFDIKTWQDQQKAAIRQRYAGMGDSTAQQNALSQIDAEAAAMTDQARQGLLTQGLSALGVAQGPLTNAAMATAQQDQAFASSQGNALNSLLLLQALQAKNGGAAAS